MIYKCFKQDMVLLSNFLDTLDRLHKENEYFLIEDLFNKYKIIAKQSLENPNTFGQMTNFIGNSISLQAQDYKRRKLVLITISNFEDIVPDILTIKADFNCFEVLKGNYSSECLKKILIDAFFCDLNHKSSFYLNPYMDQKYLEINLSDFQDKAHIFNHFKLLGVI